MGIVAQKINYLSNVYSRNKRAYEHPKVKYIVNQGGTRSGKTYSILQLLIQIGVKNSKNDNVFFIDIARKNQTEIRTTVLPDFIEILNNWELFDNRNLNKTNLTYTIGNTVFRFLGLDKAQKARGAKRDLLYINEANGITLEDWMQLNMRLTGKAFIDFNPSEEFWVHDVVLNNDKNNTAYIHSTYLDNKRFLPQSQIETIEDLINIDDCYYKVYVLGELAELKGRVYEKFETISVKDYENLPTYDIAYGIDWGWNAPIALVECKIYEGKPYYRELLYESNLRIASLDGNEYEDTFLKRIKDMGLSRNMSYYADPNEPRSIDIMRQAGYPVIEAKKNVVDGISQVKRLGLTICEDSKNLLQERKLYKYQQDPKTGVFLDKDPVKMHDHLLDALRYIAYNHDSLRLSRTFY